MSEDMSLDGGMVCTADDPSPFGTDENGMWELPEEGGIGPGPDETGMWEVPDLQTPGVEPEPSVIVDWESEPTVPDAEAPIFPEAEAVEAGEIAVEAAEGVELLEVLEIGALLLL